jgi:hypothetical protein
MFLYRKRILHSARDQFIQQPSYMNVISKLLQTIASFFSWLAYLVHPKSSEMQEINFAVTKDGYKLLDDLRQDTGSRTIFEGIRIALSTVHRLRHHFAEGGKVILEDRNGAQTVMDSTRLYKWSKPDDSE